MTDDGVQDNGQSGSTSTTLLYRVQAMDPAAWERLVHLYGPLVYHWCRRAGLQEADAADVGQDVFRAVSGRVAEFRHDRPGDTFRGWLRTIARNKIRDFTRRQNKTVAEAAGGSEALARLAALPADDPPDADPGDDAREELTLYRRAVEMILADLKDGNRQAFFRVVVDRHDPATVARELGVSVNAIYLLKSRIKRRLRAQFAGLLADL